MSFYQERYFFHLAIQCPLCHRPIQQRHAEILRDEDDAQLLFARCPSCRQSQLYLIVETHQGWETMGMKTDLSKGEIEMLFQPRSITLDEVLDLHEILHSSRYVEGMVSKIIKHHQK